MIKLVYLLPILLVGSVGLSSDLDSRNMAVVSRDPAARISISIAVLGKIKNRIETEHASSGGKYIAICGFEHVDGKVLKIRASILHSDAIYKDAFLYQVVGELSSIDYTFMMLGIQKMIENASVYGVRHKEFNWFVKRLDSIPLVRPLVQKNDWSLVDEFPDCIVYMENDSYVIRQSSGHDFWGAPLFHSMQNRLSSIKSK
jgi:hypothetical protein